MTASKPTRRIEGLDLLRGAAVGLVILCHAWPGIFPAAGTVGVVVFFALSGYLITGALLRDISSQGRVRFGRFYAHRFFRLAPALAMLVLVFSAVSLVRGDHGPGDLARSAIIAAFYLADLPASSLEPVRALRHLWTLAVEEQFYLVWPLVLLIGVKIRRLGLVLLASAAAIAVAALALPAFSDIAVIQVYRAPTSWALTLLMGAAARLYQEPLERWVRSAGAVWMAALLIVGACFIPGASHNTRIFLLLGPVIAAATIVLIFAGRKRQIVPNPARPVLWLGTVSYAAYLWNYPVITWLRPGPYEDMTLTRGLVSIVVTIALAVTSWYSAEALGRQGRQWYDSRSEGRSSTAPDDQRTAAMRLAGPRRR